MSSVGGHPVGDADEPAFALLWDQGTVPLEAIERALYSLADQVTGTVSATEGQWRLAVHPRTGQTDSEELAHLIRQTVNDHILRVRISAKTDPIRNLVFALAFSRSGLVGGDTGS